jgi:hypothetical protein
MAHNNDDETEIIHPTPALLQLLRSIPDQMQERLNRLKQIECTIAKNSAEISKEEHDDDPSLKRQKVSKLNKEKIEFAKSTVAILDKHIKDLDSIIDELQK